MLNTCRRPQALKWKSFKIIFKFEPVLAFTEDMFLHSNVSPNNPSGLAAL